VGVVFLAENGEGQAGVSRDEVDVLECRGVLEEPGWVTQSLEAGFF